MTSISWPEAVDEALCFGWIDGLRKSIDETSYAIRFTPRNFRSTWSAVNIERVRELHAEGRMRLAGLQAFAKRIEEKSGIYAYEQNGTIELGDIFERQFGANEVAWKVFEAQVAWCRKAAI